MKELLTAPSRRNEYKYLVGRELASEIKDFLKRYLKLDEYCLNGENKSYTVRSIYFDSPGFKCFHEKLEGQKYREKFRIRTYGAIN